MWVVTKGVNDYNQHGEYFVCVFHMKPTVDDLVGGTDISRKNCEYLLNSGDNFIDCGDVFYTLTNIKSGVMYEC